MASPTRVALQRYPESASACLVKSMLESEGITSTVHRVSRYAGMGGSGYVLKVGPDDVARARALIDATPGEVDMDEYVDADDTSYRRCPRCQSVMVVFALFIRLLLGLRPRLIWIAALALTNSSMGCSHAQPRTNGSATHRLSPAP